MSDLAELGVTELLEVFRSGQASPSEAVQSCLNRIAAVDGSLNAVITLCDRPAVEAASISTSRWKSREPRALEGVPFGLKDIVNTAGIRTTGGSRIYRDHVPRNSATVARHLEDAGAVLLAKLQTMEFAMGDNVHFGPTYNPWNRDRVTGGSSNGSAVALAAREMPLAIGTDTAGSIRSPASYCGVCGLKPTFGRVSRNGVMPLSWTLDHVGPMARSAADIAAALDVISSHDAADPYSIDFSSENVPSSPLDVDIRGLRIAVSTDWLLDPQVERAVEAAADVFANLGAVIVEAPLPHAYLADTISWTIMLAEMASLHSDTFTRINEYGPLTRQLLIDAQFIGASDYLRALRTIPLVQGDFQALFQVADALLAPGMPRSAPPISESGFRLGGVHYAWEEVVSRTTSIFNVAGLPALALPAGLDEEELPLGVQIVARPGADDLCLRIGQAFQSVTDHHQLTPGPFLPGDLGET